MGRVDTSEPAVTVLLSIGISILAYKITSLLVPMLGPDLLAKGLGGKDMLKPGYKRASEDQPLDKSQEAAGSVMMYVNSAQPARVYQN